MKTQLIGIALAAFGMSSTAWGQCAPEDFESFAPGTVATSIVPGVTVTAVGGSCTPGSILAQIVEPSGGTSSGTRALSLRQSCTEFSSEFMRLTFDEEQSYIRFNCGLWSGAYGQEVQIRWYAIGGVLLNATTFETGSGVFREIEITDDHVVVVEIQHEGDFWEAIDDLVFDIDDTPPLVDLTAPAFDACICGDSFVSVVGSVSDPDGDYGCDRLEYRSVNADGDTPWVEVSTACGEFTGTLHTWNTTGIPAGRYYLRVTGANECGLEQSDVTVVRIDRSFGTANLTEVRQGRDDGTLCSVVEIWGVVADGCPHTWILEYAPAGGAFVELATGTGDEYCIISEWDTTTVPDGDYTLRLTGTDVCGYSESDTMDVTVDNSRPCNCSADINGDGVVDTEDLLLLLISWGKLF